MTAALARVRRQPMIAATALVLFVAGAIAGAWLDWIWWPPYKALMTTLAAIGLLLAGLVLAAIRRRATRLLALAVVALGAGLIAGQILGPSRESPLGSDGQLVIRLTEPVAIERRTDVFCSTVPTGDHVAVSMSHDIRTGGEGDPALVFALSWGDMWDFGAEPRADALSLSITVIDTGPITDEGISSQLVVGSAPASTLTATTDGRNGSMTFDGLVPDTASGPSTGTPPSLAGTLEWTCEAPVG